MYCPPDQSRAQNLGVPNTKLRITAVVAVSGNGDFVPLFIIIKHSVSSADRPDQSNIRVMRDLHKKMMAMVLVMVGNLYYGVNH